MNLIVRLSAVPGQVVSRDELFESVWGNDVIVGDGSLTSSISELRKIFEDDPKKPQVIQTIRGRGYRLVAPVTPGNMSADDLVLSAGGDGVGASVNVHGGRNEVVRFAPSTPRPKIRYRLIVTAVVLVISGLIFLAARHASKLKPDQLFLASPLTTMRGLEYGPTFSPDGNKIAFVFFDSDKNDIDLYQKEIGASSAVRLTDLDGAEIYPTWSPDGSQVAFIWNRTEGCGIFSVSTVDGNVRKIWDSNYSLRQLSWSPDSKSIAFSYALDEAGAQQIFVLNLADQTLRQITSISSNWSDYWPVYSPDGSQIAFRRMTDDNSEDIFIVSSEGTEEDVVQLTFDDMPLMGHDWNDDGSQIIFASPREKSKGLWSVPVTGGPLNFLHPLNGNGINFFTTSAASNRAAYMQETTEINIKSLVLEPGPTQNFEQLVVGSTQFDEFPQFSPKGNQIAFVSNRSGYREIWLSKADGSGLSQLTHLENPTTSLPKWSPDGEHIIFEIRLEGQSDIFMVRVHDGHVVNVTDTASNEVAPNWSANGNRLIFGSDKSGNWSLYKRDLAQDAEEKVVDSAYEGLESPDGQFLYYTKHDSPDIWEFSYSTGISIKKSGELTNQSHHNFEAAISGLYYLNWNVNSGRFRLYRMSWSTGSSDLITSLPRKTAFIYYKWGFSISPDEKTMLFGSIDNEESDILIVENFQ